MILQVLFFGGGFLEGVFEDPYGSLELFALFFKFSGFEEKYIVPRVQSKQIDAGVLKDPRFEEACDHLENGKMERAKMLFEQLMRERPNDLDLLQDISTIYLEKGLTHDCEMISQRVLNALMIKSNFSEASEMVLRLIEASDKPHLDPQSLTRVAKWLSDNEKYGEARDVYRFILASDIPTNIYVKASVGLALLLAVKMKNPADALEILQDTEYLALDPGQSEYVSGALKQILNLYPELESSMAK